MENNIIHFNSKSLNQQDEDEDRMERIYPIEGYFCLENYLINNKTKPVEMKMAMAYGALKALNNAKEVTDNAMNALYGKFAMKIFNLEEKD